MLDCFDHLLRVQMCLKQHRRRKQLIQDSRSDASIRDVGQVLPGHGINSPSDFGLLSPRLDNRVSDTVFCFAACVILQREELDPTRGCFFLNSEFAGHLADSQTIYFEPSHHPYHVSLRSRHG